LAIFEQSTLDGYYLQTLSRDRLSAVTTAVLAGFGLLLGALGIYGSLSLSVGERVREIGVRVALGAQPRQILALVMLQGALLCGIAVTLGLFAAWGMGRLLASQLSEVSPADPLALAGAAAVLLAVGTLAILVPAYRAARLDPLLALRQE